MTAAPMIDWQKKNGRRSPSPDEAETRARWGGFAWTAENAEKAKEVIARYPAGRQASAVMPLLDLAQRQVGAETQTSGLAAHAGDRVRREARSTCPDAGRSRSRPSTPCSIWPRSAAIHVQVCGTTPCMLRGSDDVLLRPATRRG